MIKKKTKKILKKYKDDGKLAVCMTVRNNLKYLKLALNSLENRKSGKIDIHYFIYLDDCTDGTMEWLTLWKIEHPKVNLTVNSNTSGERVGLTGGTLKVMKMVKDSKITRYWLVHADMVFPFNWDINICEYMIPKRIISATRIEPPIFPSEPCKIQKAFGNNVDEFGKISQLKYLWYIWKDMLFTKKHNHLPTKGFFAPYGGFVSDWWKHPVDLHIGKQSREETDMAYRMKLDDYDFFQTWKVLVYHFGGRGDRFKTNDLSAFDSDWATQNEMSTQNFIRKWGQMPLHDEWSYPNLVYAIKEKMTLNLLVKNGGHTIYKWLNFYEPWFDEIVIMNDKSTDNTLDEIKRFIDSKKDKVYHYYFDPKKIKVFTKALNKDFGKAHNEMIKKSKHRWIVHADLDEQFPISLLQGLRGVIQELIRNKKTVCGFPRLNLVDGKAFNPDNPDYQFRLYTKDTKWINKVHEAPEKIVKKKEFPPALCAQFGKILHAKTSVEHNSGQELYDTIHKGAGNRRV